MASLPCDPRTPVIIGTGQVSREPCSDSEPIALAIEALRVAGADTTRGETLLRRADSVRHVATICWPYSNEAALIAAGLGATPRETVRTAALGGDGPQRLIGDTARGIAAGEIDIALLSGAESVASLRAARKDGIALDWPDQPSNALPTRTVGQDRMPSNDPEIAVGLMAPVYNYALIETALRGRLGLGVEQHMRGVADLWSRFSAVAADNPHARLPRLHTAEELLAQSTANRPVSLPYPKLLTANIQVDQATGLVMSSAEAASSAGVPLERWVFVAAGAHAEDEWFLSERAELARSPAIQAVGRAALGYLDLAADELAYVDLYSCFPSAVQIAAHELGLATDDPERPLTVTGGLTFAGGPGNNYSSHATATLVDLLRADPSAFGLCTALGWYITKHAATLYCGRPPAKPFHDFDAGQSLARPGPRPARSDYSGIAAIEAYTVPFDSDGRPEAAIVAGLTPNGERVLARSTDADLIEAAVNGDPLGQAATFQGQSGAVTIG